MNKNQTNVLIVKNNDLHDIEIPRWEDKFHVNGAAKVQFTKGYKDGKRVINIAIQVRDKKTRFQLSSFLTAPFYRIFCSLYLCEQVKKRKK